MAEVWGKYCCEIFGEVLDNISKLCSADNCKHFQLDNITSNIPNYLKGSLEFKYI